MKQSSEVTDDTMMSETVEEKDITSTEANDNNSADDYDKEKSFDVHEDARDSLESDSCDSGSWHIVGKEEHESAKEKTAQENIDEKMPTITDASPMDAEKKEFVILSEENHHFVISSQVLEERKISESTDKKQDSGVLDEKNSSIQQPF